MSAWSGLPAIANLVGLWDFTKGSFRDVGPNTSTDGTPTNSPYWRRSGSIYVPYFARSNDENIWLVENAAVDSLLQGIGNNNGYSIGAYVYCMGQSGQSPADWSTADTILELRQAAGAAGTKVPFSFGVAGSSDLVGLGRTHDYTTSDEVEWSTGTFKRESWVTLGAVVDNDDVDFFIDGLLDSSATFAVATGDCSVSTANCRMRIASRSTDAGAEANLFRGDIAVVALWGTNIAEAEMAQFHQWCMQQRSRTKRKKYWTGVSHPSRLALDSNLAGAWDLADIANGAVVDRSGNGNDGTVNGFMDLANTEIGKAGKFDTDGKMTASAVDVTTGNSSWELIFFYESQGVNTHLLENNNSGTNKANLFVGTAGGVRFTVNDGSLKGASEDTNLVSGTWNHICGTYDGSNPALYINGVKQTGTSTQGISTNTGLTIGKDNGAGTGYDGLIKHLLWTTDLWSQGDVDRRYKQFASQPTFVDDLSDANVSVAAEGAAIGDYLSNTNWQFGDTAARYKISEDTIEGEVKKVLECTTAGLLYIESPQAYGTWEFDLYSNNGVTRVHFVASVIGSTLATGQDAYRVYIHDSGNLFFQKSNNGSNSNLCWTAASYIAYDTWYRFRVTRRFDGQFSWYIKGGAYTEWQLVDVSGGGGTNPTTDTTHTDSTYTILDSKAGDQLANFCFYQGVVAP